MFYDELDFLKDVDENVEVLADDLNSILSQIPKLKGCTINLRIIKSKSGSSSIAFRSDEYRNRASDYGYWYMKTDKFREKYLQKEKIKMDKNYKYYVNVSYLERNLTKTIPTNTIYDVGNILILESKSQGFDLAKVINCGEIDAYTDNLFPRRIISKVVDEYGKLLTKLEETQKEIKNLNKYISENYLLILLNNETNEELEQLKIKLKNLLQVEKDLNTLLNSEEN